MNQAEKLLAQIRAQVTLAEAALADEHEGDFRRAVLLISTDADQLAELVAGW